MPEMDNRDALKFMVDYYMQERGFTLKDTCQLVNILVKADIAELVRAAFTRGAEDMRVEK